MPPVASVAPPYAGGAVVRPAAVPRLGSQMMQQQQSEGGASSISNKGNVLGVQLLQKLPPLPPLPAVRQDVPAALSWLQSSAAAKHGLDGDGKEVDQNAAPSVELDGEARGYITSLHDAVQAYERREEAMQLRLEAMAFRPTESWTALRIERGDEEDVEVEEKEKADGDVASSSIGPAPPASVLGVRLLRKVTELQRENEELGALLSKRLGLEEQEDAAKGEAAVTVNGVPPQSGEVDKLLGDLEGKMYWLARSALIASAADSAYPLTLSQTPTPFLQASLPPSRTPRPVGARPRLPFKWPYKAGQRASWTVAIVQRHCHHRRRSSRVTTTTNNSSSSSHSK